MYYEIIGIIASIIVLISFLTKGEKRIRQINLFGCIGWTIYGVLIKSYSVLFFNVAIFFIQTYKLYQLNRGNKDVDNKN